MGRTCFLDLSPELRNMVYSYLMPKAPEEDLDIMSWRDWNPNQSITQVNRQIRSESILLYKETVTHLWNHKWSLTVEIDKVADKTYRDNLLNRSMDFPSSPRVREFRLIVELPVKADGGRWPVYLDFCMGDEFGQWKLLCRRSYLANCLVWYRARDLKTGIRQSLRDLGSCPPATDDDKTCLDVRQLVRALLAAFESSTMLRGVPWLARPDQWKW